MKTKNKKNIYERKKGNEVSFFFSFCCVRILFFAAASALALARSRGALVVNFGRLGNLKGTKLEQREKKEKQQQIFQRRKRK